MQIGLLFGSFDPIHQGHLMLGQYMLQFENLDEVWYVLSPQNPFKTKIQLSDVHHRLNMLQLALNSSPSLKICERELTMPSPSYTIDTISTLQSEYPSHNFAIIMGTDNISTFNQWKDYQTLLDSHRILVYPRLGYPNPKLTHPNIKISPAPVIEISSTTIRQWINANKDVRHFIPIETYRYIICEGLYKRAGKSE